MKHLRIIGVCLFFLQIFTVTAQDIKVQTSLLDKEVGADASKNLGGDESGFYVASFTSKYKFEVGFNATGTQSALVIQKFSNDLKLLAEKEIVQDDDESLEWPILLGGDLYSISFKLNKKSKTWNVYGQKLETDKLYNSGTPILLYSKKQGEDEFSLALQTALSPDKKSIAFHSFYSPGAGWDYARVLDRYYGGNSTTIAVFGEGMVKNWEKEIVIPYGENKYTTSQVQVDNNGDVYVLGWRFGAEINKMKPSANKAITSLHKITNKGATITELELNIKGVNILDGTMAFDKTGNIMVSGICNSNDEPKEIDAFYAISVDKSTLTIANATSKKFTADLLKRLETNKNANLEFSLDELLLMDNGDFIFLIEEFIYSETQAGGVYSALSLISVGIDANAGITWMNAVPKKQYTILDDYTSYNFMQTRDKIYLFYNGNVKNVNAKSYAELEDYQAKNSAIMMVTISSDGTYKKVVIPAEISTYQLRVTMSQQSTKDKFIFFAKDGKKEYIGAIQFN
ncbi:MAG: hypothetical protein WBP43_15470 [Chitinophagales bacterium]